MHERGQVVDETDFVFFVANIVKTVELFWTLGSRTLQLQVNLQCSKATVMTVMLRSLLAFGCNFSSFPNCS